MALLIYVLCVLIKTFLDELLENLLNYNNCITL